MDHAWIYLCSWRRRFLSRVVHEYRWCWPSNRHTPGIWSDIKKKHHTVSMCTEDKMSFPNTISYNIITISIYLSLKLVCDADIWNKFYFFQMINRPSLLAASATECRRHNWHKAGKVTLQFSGICNCGLSIWRTTYGGLSPRCSDIEFKVARVSVSKGTVWTCALHWNSQTLRLI